MYAFDLNTIAFGCNQKKGERSISLRKCTKLFKSFFKLRLSKPINEVHIEIWIHNFVQPLDPNHAKCNFGFEFILILIDIYILAMLFIHCMVTIFHGQSFENILRLRWMNPVAKSSTISFHMISYKEQKKITKTKIRKSTAQRETEKKCILNIKIFVEL